MLLKVATSEPLSLADVYVSNCTYLIIIKWREVCLLGALLISHL